MNPPPSASAVVDRPTAATGRLVVEVAGIHKAFQGTQALAGVSVAFPPGGVTGIVGPNGSGKTTLLRCMTGALAPDRGVIRIDGQDYRRVTPQLVAARGVAQTFQRVVLAEDMTVTENVLLALDARAAPSPTRLPRELIGRRGRLGAQERDGLLWALEMTRLEPFVDTMVGHLPLGIRRRVELARAIVCRPRGLVLDEPTSGLDPTETGSVVGTIQSVHKESGVTVVIVEHDMSVIAQLCSTLVVLESGVEIARGSVDEVFVNRRVQEAYLGATG